MTQSDPSPQAPEGDTFIPDLCRMKAVFFLVLITELVLVLFALARAGTGWIDWNYLGLASLLTQWVTLTSAGLICVLRRFFVRHTVITASVLCTLVVLADAALFTLLGQWLLSPGTLPGIPDPSGLARNLLMAAIITLMMLRYFYLQYQHRQQEQAQLEARVAALQARIQPHFLFNSMNTIASLIGSDPKRAEEVVLDLSELFRASLNTAGDRLIPLRDEIRLCERYLAIETTRLGERLQVEWSLAPEADDIPVPPLTLQPLLENAVYHGIQPLTEGGTITIETELSRDRLYLLIRNPLPSDTERASQGHRMALDNIASRLAAVYGTQGALKTSQDGEHFTVTLRLPR
ncbi:two-component system sensor histidine kinase AlgZ [Halospina denitrificans]|uniref:Two-component system sensor histidine kinase AlgZ n=1 Tax=Halospina denitrificans TaxID=332522 RepID=A0A4R7K1T5_9GAMM|nr:sensor histidine kinase [Halospina denitrificans]TDT44324.1 two-component system sensor histidine kinase AlgZ [Halospina denitrificans]